MVIFCVNGINIIVPAAVGADGRTRIQIDWALILKAVGLPENACVRWGF